MSMPYSQIPASVGLPRGSPAEKFHSILLCSYLQQWGTFARTWHLYDCRWQNPFEAAESIKAHLMGLHKPIYHPLSRSLNISNQILVDKFRFSIYVTKKDQCGDHVVVINTAEIALPGDEWRKRVYFHHTGYPGGASWTLAWELHKKDPKMV